MDIRIAIGDSETADGGIQHGAALRRYAVAILKEEPDLIAARAACIEALGENATAQAASIIASFDGINRVADATGIRLDPEMAGGLGAGISEELGLQEPAAARA